jgi:hypothetical protein
MIASSQIHNESKGLKMMATKEADKITGHIDLTIMKAGKKNLRSSGLQEILGRSDSY